MKNVGILLMLATAAIAQAVSPQAWTQTSESDFAAGQLKGTVVSSLGQVRLGPAIDVIWPTEKAPQIVSCLAVHGGVLYVGSGDDNTIYRRDGENFVDFSRPQGTLITALASDKTGLLAGTGGDGAGLYRIGDDGQAKRLWTDDTLKYVWAIAVGRDGTIFLGTGPNARVVAVDASGQAKVLFKTDTLAANILSLALGADGTVFAGTDQNGLVLAIDPEGKGSRVIMDAEENEVAALVVAKNGGIYAATADTSRTGKEGAPPKEAATGRAPRVETATTAPSQPARQPSEGPDNGDGGSGEGPDQPGDNAPDQPASPPNAGDPPQADAPAADVPTTAGAIREASVSRSAPAEQARPVAVEVPKRTSREAGPDAAPDVEQIRKMIERQASASTQRGQKAKGKSSRGEGNAIYYIQPDGLVREVFRRPLAILAMAQRDGYLFVGTGNEGGVYALTGDGDEVVRLADTDAEQVTALVVAQDGMAYFSTANGGSVVQVKAQLAQKGQFLSDVLDASQVAKWGTIQVRTTPGKGQVGLSTRSGNVSDPDDATWSAWSSVEGVKAGEAVQSGKLYQVASPTARFLQYRLELSESDHASPVVEDVEAIYQVGNLAPEIASVEVTATAKGGEQHREEGPQMFRQVAVDASDPNDDTLTVEVDVRPMSVGPWVQLTDDIEGNEYTWDTRSVSDGVYELKVVASDAPSNPAPIALKAVRISEPVVVDNTPPQVTDLTAKVADDGSVTVAGTAADAGSRVVSIQYSVDSQDDWLAVLPDDGICDSQTEKFNFKTDALDAGAHRIAVRATDVFQNVGYSSAVVTVTRH